MNYFVKIKYKIPYYIIHCLLSNNVNVIVHLKLSSKMYLLKSIKKNMIISERKTDDFFQ